MASALTTPYKSTPVGFEPTRGDPIGLAGRRLSRSAKVSSAKSASQLPSSPGSRVTVSLCFLCSPLTSPPYPLSPTHENSVHQPGIEPGLHRWQRCILPLDHRRLWKIFGLDSYRLQIPLVLLFRLRCMTQPSQANPHRSFLAPFQPPVRNPQETPGKPKETLTVAAETRR